MAIYLLNIFIDNMRKLQAQLLLFRVLKIVFFRQYKNKQMEIVKYSKHQ